VKENPELTLRLLYQRKEFWITDFLISRPICAIRSGEVRGTMVRIDLSHLLNLLNQGVIERKKDERRGKTHDDLLFPQHGAVSRSCKGVFLGET
jgi:hypothetical protein